MIRVFYRRGPRVVVRHAWPFYHRKYVFVSLGGWWPAYRHVRYYWYGWHPYRWYGSYPVLERYAGDTYSYYTYNYYGGSPAPAEGGLAPADHTTFEDVRERLSEQAAEPGAQTLADRYFADAVEAFEKGRYGEAADKLEAAVAEAEDDIVMPFAYVQALFACGRYSEAAGVLRESLDRIEPDREGLFFPRGLYTDDDVFSEQIDALAAEAERFSMDADLQLLLGYQLLGAGRLEEAHAPLAAAKLDSTNEAAAVRLLELLEKVKAGSGED
jgi:tetratricopeptide (TPR) repeat protein